MTIKVGDKLPAATFLVMGKDGPEPVASGDYFKGRKIVLFGVPGAFTPTCSAQHLPSYVQNIDALKAKGADAVACVAVNDVFVMDAWGKATGATGKVDLLADGSGEFAKAAGLVFDLTAKGLGVRNQRFSAIVDDGKVTALNIEEPGEYCVSGGDSILDQL